MMMIYIGVNYLLIPHLEKLVKNPHPVTELTRPDFTIQVGENLTYKAA